MVVKEENGRWKIIRLELDHNHPLYPGNREQLFSGHKYMTEMEKAIIRTLNANNIATRQMISILSYLRGGVTALPYKKKDVANFRTKLNRVISGSDMKQALNYFIEKKNKDPSFFYKFDVDEHLRVKNIFWRDAESLKYYAEFGDCVSFDTTYMTNKYNLPFAPFVGVTGHGHTCFFGCAFICDETIDTFKWVFESFIEAMGGKHPTTIITDQDAAMKAAIEQTFPNTKHMNCLFHIKTKCYNKNLKCFASNEGLPEEFEDVVGNSLTIEEFETLWTQMIADYKLENNKYFNKMWEMRERFIPVYFKNDFYPFLQSTARSESTNARIKRNVGPTYSITSFLTEYQRIVDAINVAEDIEDNANKQKTPKEMEFGYSIELQAMEMYSRNILSKFMKELRATTRLSYKELEQQGQYEVWEKQNQIHKRHRFRKYIVITDLTNGREDYSCICGKFNKDGILCSHILKILVETEASKIPDKYIIERWRKKERKMQLKKVASNTGTDDILRFNILSRKAAELTSKGATKEKAMEYLLEEFSRIGKNLDIMLATRNKQIPQETSTADALGPTRESTIEAQINIIIRGYINSAGPSFHKEKRETREAKKMESNGGTRKGESKKTTAEED
ncbi:hypothetical protein BDA96_04G249900 [Sorghum bicolor]|uniref:SWIM-type domain-containing protein n=2 Tax=Sorghum bicolor TaxID=4558 RepID=A0A921UK65_SORBI|nr:hypothetical protein BDA96_04G249900 [Sorghum bicolor]OQU85417.1 hypothetical protein SORBI_3004G234766 [Sorghum bicolor]